ncbi:MAG TPA: trypsin-like peptidase domain-containing protein [Pyrinomonadaceae bacterium]|nr:trypsin-like peptidase domain-containing protein [Pyrinomonadaceae bacterium]
MYKLTARQILMVAFASAVFAVVGVIGFQQIYNRLPFGSAAVAPLASITDPALATDEQNNIEVYKAISPGVVNISSTTLVRGFFGLMVEPEEGTCSGSIIDDQGNIVTNYHCIENVQKLTVSLGGGRKYPARVVGGDIDTDLAVIRMTELPREPLTLVPLGDSDKLSVGQKVLAIGNPFGLDRTLTTGVISGLERPIRAQNNRQIEGAIQTDASINPGNSGGPLLDSHGRMIGINSQILSPSGASAGVGFAIPVSIAKRIVPELVRNGSIQRPKLGIQPRDIASLGSQSQLPVSDGVLILATQPGGPAANAGLRGLVETEDGQIELGDIIVAIDGEKIENNDDIYKVMDKHHMGDTVNVEVIRRGRRLTVPVKLTEAPTTRRRGFGE